MIETVCLWQLTHTLHCAWVKIQVWEARSRKLGAGSINGRRGGSLEAPGIRTIDPSRALWSQDYPSSPFHSASMAKFFLFGESTNAQLGWFIFQNSKRALTSSKSKFNHPKDTIWKRKSKKAGDAQLFAKHLNISCSPASNLNIKERALHTVQCSLHFFSSECTELINCIELNIAPPQWSWQGALCFCQIWHRLNNPLAFSTPVQVPIPQTISFWVVQICNTNFSSLLDSHYQNSYLYLAVWCIIFQTQARYVYRNTKKAILCTIHSCRDLLPQQYQGGISI